MKKEKAGEKSRVIDFTARALPDQPFSIPYDEVLPEDIITAAQLPRFKRRRIGPLSKQVASLINQLTYQEFILWARENPDRSSIIRLLQAADLVGRRRLYPDLASPVFLEEYRKKRNNPAG